MSQHMNSRWTSLPNLLEGRDFLYFRDLIGITGVGQ